MANVATKLEQRYRAHLARCAPELIEQEAEQAEKRAWRGLVLVLVELRECRRDTASMLEAEAVALTDWEATAEARRGR